MNNTEGVAANNTAAAVASGHAHFAIAAQVRPETNLRDFGAKAVAQAGGRAGLRRSLQIPARLGQFARVLGFGCLYLMLLEGWALIYQSVASNIAHIPRQGRLIEVHGDQLHLYCTGTGSPTVVMDAAEGLSWLEWYRIRPEIAKFTRVCVFDRPGIGWSHYTVYPQTTAIIAEEVHLLLQKAGERPPYLLVGHGFGGMDMRLLAERYPQGVQGLILIDTPNENFYSRLFPEAKRYRDSSDWKPKFMEVASIYGLPRFMGACGNGPEPIRRQLAYLECETPYFKANNATWASWRESEEELRTGGNLGDLPLLVLSRDPDRLDSALPPDLARKEGPAWEAVQEELQALSSNSRRTIAKGSGHMIPLENPAMVVEAVRRMLRPPQRLWGKPFQRGGGVSAQGKLPAIRAGRAGD